MIDRHRTCDILPTHLGIATGIIIGQVLFRKSCCWDLLGKVYISQSLSRCPVLWVLKCLFSLFHDVPEDLGIKNVLCCFTRSKDYRGSFFFILTSFGFLQLCPSHPHIKKLLWWRLKATHTYWFKNYYWEHA